MKHFAAILDTYTLAALRLGASALTILVAVSFSGCGIESSPRSIKNPERAGAEFRQYHIQCEVPPQQQCRHSEALGHFCVRRAEVRAQGDDRKAIIFLTQDLSSPVEVRLQPRQIILKEQVERWEGGEVSWVIASDDLSFPNGPQTAVVGENWIKVEVRRSGAERTISATMALEEDFGFDGLVCSE